MRLRHKNWMYGLLAAGFALSLTAAGCGDDDSGDDVTAGTGGAKAGTGGTGGAKAGTGGTGGAKAGTGGTTGGTGGTGGPVNPAVCKSETMTAVMGGLNMDCINCICDANAMAVLACTRDAMKMCWPLISCIGAMCPGLTGNDQTQCAIMKCGTNLSGGANAMMAGPVITGSMCMSKCVTSGGGDAGVKDAGF